MPNNLENLEKEIRSKLPHTMELSAGCEIIGERSRISYLILEESNGICKCITDDFCIVEINLSLCTTIGHPITLTNVLEWLQIISNNGLEYTDRILKCIDFWDLSKTPLREQSTELIDSLFNLIEKR